MTMWIFWMLLVGIAIAFATNYEMKRRDEIYNRPENRDKRRLNKIARDYYKSIELEALSKWYRRAVP